MKRVTAILIAAICIMLSISAHAEQSNKKYFVGLWRGIDFYDGSEILISITTVNSGEYNIIWTEPYFGGCNGGRGVAYGSGMLEDGAIYSDDLILTCFPGTDIVISSTKFVPDKSNGTLLVEIVNSQFISTIMHKISE
jgi:hypothetical protein